MKDEKRKVKIYEFMADNNTSIEEILDVIIESNGLVGVGVISLQDQIEKHLLQYWWGISQTDDALVHTSKRSTTNGS